MTGEMRYKYVEPQPDDTTPRTSALNLSGNLSTLVDSSNSGDTGTTAYNAPTSAEKGKAPAGQPWDDPQNDEYSTNASLQDPGPYPQVISFDTGSQPSVMGQYDTVGKSFVSVETHKS